jgi:outer membrane lipoprotein carrier protein
MTNLVLAFLLAAGTAAPSTTPSPSTAAPTKTAPPPTAAAPTKTAPPPTAAAPMPPELRNVLDRMQKRYDQAKDFRARFSQNYSRGVVGRATLSTGTLTFKKPGRMRWDYEKPEPRMFLATGQVLWLYEPEEKQAFKQDLKSSQLPAALAFLMGKGKLADEFEIAFAPEPAADAKQKLPGRPGDLRLQLSPKQPQSTYKSILFVVDPREFLVRESVLVDAQGNANHFVFDDVVVNTKVADSLFKWTPPAGVRVVDTNQMGK